MAASGRAGSWERELSRTTNCSGIFFARSVCWFAGQPVIRPYILVKRASAQPTRGGHGKNARFSMAERAMEQCLYLQGCTCRHGSGTWLGLSTVVHYSVTRGHHCAARIKREIFRCEFPADGGL